MIARRRAADEVETHIVGSVVDVDECVEDAVDHTCAFTFGPKQVPGSLLAAPAKRAGDALAVAAPTCKASGLPEGPSALSTWEQSSFFLLLRWEELGGGCGVET